MRQTLAQWHRKLFGGFRRAKARREREKKEPKELVLWMLEVGGELLQTKAHTKAEARARFKRHLQVERLPAGAVVVRKEIRGGVSPGG